MYNIANVKNHLFELVGKTSINKDATLPVLYHLYDVALVGDFLWKYWFSDEAKKDIESHLPNAHDIFILLCYIHDLGKFSIDFQNQIKGEKYRHNHIETFSYLLVIYIIKEFGYTKKKATDLLENSIVREIVSYHHGIHSDKPIYVGDVDLDTQFPYLDDIIQVIKDILVKCNLTSDIFFLRYTDIIFHVRDELSGLLIDADWIGSNESICSLYKDTLESYEDREKRITRYLFSLFTPCKIKKFNSPESFFSSVFKFPPTELQKSVFSINTKEKKLVFIEAPTGHGKTEAALSLAYKYLSDCEKLNGKGIYLAMPTRATSNAMYDRVCDFINNTFDGKDKLVIHHSKSKLSLNNKEDNKVEFKEIDKIDAWKKHIFKYKLKNANRFLLGTVDYILPMCMDIKHFPMHHTCLINHVIIFDEVHSYDDVMFSCLRASLAILSKFKVPIIILSATIPNWMRELLIEAYGKDESISLNAYPDNSGNEDSSMIRVKGNKDKKLVKFDLTLQQEYQSSTDCEKDARAIMNKIKQLGTQGYYGIIVNTVKRAQDLYDIMSSCFGKDNTILLHSRLEFTHREQIEKEIISTLGKCGFSNRKEKNIFKIVISTQIVEQSIDIDFDCIFSDLCPMDALIQRVGRLHRHNQNDEYRPDNLKEPICYVLQAYNINTDNVLNNKEELNKCVDYYSSSMYDSFKLYSTYIELLNLKEGYIDTENDTASIINLAYDFSDIENKKLMGISIKEAFYKYRDERHKKENETFRNMLKGSYNEGVKWFKLDFEKEANLFCNGVNACGDNSVRYNIDSLEVVVMKKDVISNKYVSCYDGKEIDVSNEIELEKHTLSLSRRVIDKCDGSKVLEEIIKSSNYNTPLNKYIPCLVFDEYNHYHIKEGVDLYYDKEKGLSDLISK